MRIRFLGRELDFGKIIEPLYMPYEYNNLLFYLLFIILYNMLYNIYNLYNDDDDSNNNNNNSKRRGGIAQSV